MRFARENMAKTWARAVPARVNSCVIEYGSGMRGRRGRDLYQSNLEFSVEWVSRFSGHMTVHPHHLHARLDILEIH
jgi:hypothetical protein